MMTKATDKMNTVRKTLPQEARLHRCMMITDGNVSRANRDRTLPEQSDNLVSEALLPQIRAVAVMIAAMRHDFGPHSPVAFTDDADWFAARILVLRVRAFHIGIGRRSVLAAANRRAAAFAERRGLPFVPATAVLSLQRHGSGITVADCALPCGGSNLGPIENARRIAAQLPDFS